MNLFICLFCALFVFVSGDIDSASQDMDLEETFTLWSKYLYPERMDSDYWGYVKYDPKFKTLTIYCYGGRSIVDVEPLKKSYQVKNLIIFCMIPPKPLIETLQGLNVNASSIEMLKLTAGKVLPSGMYTQGLPKTLRIFWTHEAANTADIFQNNPDFFKPLTNLTSLMAGSMKLPSLPSNIKLKAISLSHFAWASSWNNCEDLESLRIETVYPKSLPAEWPENCKKLTSLRLQNILQDQVNTILSRNLYKGCKYLLNLYIVNCFPDKEAMKILNEAAELRQLHMVNDNLIDPFFADFPMMEKLVDLNLSNNLLEGWFLYDLVKKLPALRNLVLDSNKLTTSIFCDYEKKTNFFTSHLTFLESLSINNMSLTLGCLGGQRFAKLKFLSQNAGSYLNSNFFEMYMLPLTNSTHLEVYFQGYPAMKIIPSMIKKRYEDFLEDDASALWGAFPVTKYVGTNYTLHFSVINCQCNHYWLAKALRENPQNFVTLPDVLCDKSKQEFAEEPLDTMDCVEFWKNSCYITVEGAFGSERNERKVAKAECHDFQGRLQFPLTNDYTTIGLNATRNMIENINNISSVPRTLQWIDLRDNKLMTIDGNESALLFSNPERHVWLSRNEFRCTCQNKILLDSLHEHQQQVEDFKEIICIDTGLPLYMTSSYEVCQVAQKVSIGFAAFFLALFLVAGVILWRYRFQIKIFLYSRGLCLFWLQEEDLDVDKTYDAFLSFAHGDDEYVMEYLLPKLEGEPDFYRICVHYRDWVVGDWIPTQIMRSVQESKRTIVVLSKNFLTSMWGSLEFRYAVGNGVQEGNSRLIVLILGDVLTEELSPEVQGYISYHTYLRCDDPWFWNKLKFAMPHRKPNRVPLPREVEIRIESENVVECNLNTL